MLITTIIAMTMKEEVSFFAMSNSQKITSIYNEDYARLYDELYVLTSIAKHEVNAENIERILWQSESDQKAWLDTCCGQAWHFTRGASTVRKIGVDISPAQLELAKLRNPDAEFILGDILEINFPDNSFDLVTNFWAAYCYLDSFESIETLLNKAVRWTKPGGTIYFDVLTGEFLKEFDFNISGFAQQTGFSVIPRTPDFVKWSYHDVGGVHNMTSPPLDFFTDILSKSFNQIETTEQGTMIHLIASGKTASEKTIEAN